MSLPKPSLDELRIERRPESPAGSRIWLLVVLGVALLLVGAGVWWWRMPKAIEIRTVAARATVDAGGNRTVLNASGYVVARREATVSSKITGKVVEVLIEEGMSVREGQVLARLDDTNVKASLRLAEAELASARSGLDETRARLRQAELELKRLTELAKSRIASTAELDQAEAEAAALRARLAKQEQDVNVSERQVAVWQQQLEDTIIRAPFAGVVTSKNAQPGEMISPVSAGGGFTRTGICTIVDMASLEIEIDVNEGYINRVEAGQPVQATLDAYPEWKIPCTVIATIPTADRQKSTVRVRVGFDKLDRRILPEMSVKVAFRETGVATVNAARNVAVPKAALQEQNGRDVVWVAQNGRAERRAVTVSQVIGEEAELSAGLSGGERVVVNRPVGLADGSPVKELTP
ncbi:MAG TPA: efflux RND transporter periplasmic adaptor subunit [Verrucomicrobiae bacterium]